MKKSVLIAFRLAALAALGLAAAAAGAQPLVTVRVVSVQPIVQQVPMSDCGPYGYREPSGAGAAVGALAGGLVGSQLGRGNGHIAGAMLGALGGAIVGNAAEASSQSGGCVTRYGQQVLGYDVAYEYAGRQYSTRMGSPPGQWMQVPAPDPSGGAYVDSPPAYAAPPPPPTTAYQDYPPADAVPPGVAAAPPPDYYEGGAYPPPPVYPQAYPQPYPQAYPQPYPPPPGYPVYPAPVYVQPAPVYAAPPVGIGLSFGGRVGGHHGRGGVGVGIGIGN